MALTPLQYMPAAHECGETLSVTLSYGDYPSSTHTAVLLLNIVGSAAVSTAGTTSGGGFNFLVSAATTAAMTPGNYQWTVRVTETASGQKANAEGGQIYFMPDLSSTVSRTVAETQLNNVQTAISSLLSKKQSEVEFNGQKFKLQDIEKLFAIQLQLKRDVTEEQETFAEYRGQYKSRSIRPYFV